MSKHSWYLVPEELSMSTTPSTFLVDDITTIANSLLEALTMSDKQNTHLLLRRDIPNVLMIEDEKEKPPFEQSRENVDMIISQFKRMARIDIITHDQPAKGTIILEGGKRIFNVTIEIDNEVETVCVSRFK